MRNSSEGPRVKPKKITVIEWEDPSGDQDSWVPVRGAHDESAIVLSVGWCYKEDENYVYLAMDWSDDGHVHQIPEEADEGDVGIGFSERFFNALSAQTGNDATDNEDQYRADNLDTVGRDDIRNR